MQHALVTGFREILFDGGREFGASGERQGPLSFRDGFLVLSYVRVNFLENSPGRRKFRINIQNFSQLFDGLIVLTCEIKLPSQRGIDDE